MLTRIMAWLRAWWAAPLSTRLYQGSMVGVVLAGTVFRLIGQLFDRPCLWTDEAFWAKRLLSTPLVNLRMRPIGFMWLVKQSVLLLGPSEFSFRLVSNVASILTLALAPYLASQLLSKRTSRFLFVLLVALHPVLIDFSKEFKPYSFEVFVHVVPIVLYLRYRETNRNVYKYAFMGCLPLLVWLTFNIAFALPGLLILGLVLGLRERGIRGAILPVASGAACVAVLGVLYVIMFRDIISPKQASFWGQKYGVFFQSDAKPTRRIMGTDWNNRETYIDWVEEKYGDLAGFAGTRREIWRPPSGFSIDKARELSSADRSLWILLHVLGVAFLVRRRRWDDGLLLIAPMVPVLILNRAGIWPMGAFRTNLFLCPHMVLIAMLGVDFLASLGRVWTWVSSGAVFVTTILPGFAFGFDWKFPKQLWTRNHEERLALDLLHQFRQEDLALHPDRVKERLIVDNHGAHSQTFYMKYIEDVRTKHRKFFNEHFRFEFARGATSRMKTRLYDDGDPIWVLISNKPKIAGAAAFARRIGKVLLERRIGNDHLIMHIAPNQTRPDVEPPKEEADDDGDSAEDLGFDETEE